MKMSVVDEFVRFLKPRAEGSISGVAKLVITDEGSVMLDQSGAREGDDLADVTLLASQEVFRNILDGSQNPMMAYMSGKLKVEGSTTRALKVSAILTAA
ncbi:MAG: putative sterol carrier protein [Paracoccaceae bacterium]|jgi:putative sterol carrier protein